MPFTSPTDLATGNVLTAARMDQDRDDLIYLATTKPHCRVYNDANISVATSGTDQALTFNTERFDVGSMHSTAANTSRITIPANEGGKYLIGGHIAWAGNTTGDRQIGIFLNGTSYIAAHRQVATSATALPQSISTLYNLAAGDYLELYVLQTSGGALNVTASSLYSPEFWAIWQAT